MAKLIRLCRLCLESSDDSVNIFENFQGSTIASILTQHFWFKAQKNDGLSECICQVCWISTKTFHNFYKRIEWRQKNFSNSVQSIKVEPSFCSVVSPTLEPDLSIVKCEETEATAEVLIIQEEDGNDDSSSYVKSENEQTSDDEEQSSNKKRKHDIARDHTKNKTLPTSSSADKDIRIGEFFNMECNICNDPFETFRNAKKHHRKVHGTSGYLVCACGRRCHRRGAALAHIDYHLNPSAFTCDKCGKKFRDICTMKIHIESHDSVDPRRNHKCNLCSKSYQTAKSLAKHELIKHSSEEDKKFHCDKCNKKWFVTQAMLNFHVRGDHDLAFAHVCDIRAHVSKSKHILLAHMKTHSTVTRPLKVQCNICGTWLAHERGLRTHLARHQDITVNCPICNKVVQNKFALIQHTRRVHGERRHHCAICDKAFKTPMVLKEHMALHTGEDLYKCEYCTKTFKSGANMYTHRKKSHFAEWNRDFRKRIKLERKSDALQLPKQN